MKKNYSTKLVFILIFFLIGVINLEAQMVYIPDGNFRTKLTNLGYGSCIVGDSIDSNCPMVLSTTSLNLSVTIIHDLQGIQAFGNLTDLSCGSDSLANLPGLPNSLSNLACYNNQLTNLPPLPNSLTDLDCSGNLISSLPTLPNSLAGINCYNNQLTTLPSLPSSLQAIWCYNNQLVTLPPLPTSLANLNCSSNQLTNLPLLPNSLTYLNCSYNQLTDLPTLPGSMTVFLCAFNQLITLPALPNSLTYLGCNTNQIINIPPLPNLLNTLGCNHNQLSSLPTLPNSIVNLNCSQNLLTSLPSLPHSLVYLNCGWNPLLTSLPDLPDTMNELICQSDSSLFCLPQLKRIVNFDFWATPITCLPNYSNITTIYPTGLQVCGIFNNINGCPFNWNINGKCYFDSNINCLFNIGDIRQQNMPLLLYKNGNLIQQTLTNGEGYYSFDVNDSVGNYSVRLDTSNIPFSVLCPVNINYNDTITPSDSLFYDDDFALKCKTGFDIGGMSIVGFPFRPAHNTTVYIEAGDIANFYGTHCSNGINGSVTISFTGPVTYVSPAPGALTPNSVSSNTLTYNISDFGIVNLFTAFNIIVHTDNLAVLNSPICFTVSALPISGDNNPSNNMLTGCFRVRTSFDPNEKEVYPASNVDPIGDRWLTYTIHFQNTGTAAAEHIYITDTLDSYLDLSTFQLLAYSHQPLVQILEGGIARFNFPNINLPDSNMNEPASHGYVQYKIKLKDNAPVGTQISNTAYIYFDFNTPVVTNTTVNTVMTSIGILETAKNDLQVSVFPNPTRNEFTVYCSQFKPEKKVLMKVIDTFGKEMLSKQVTTVNTKLETGSWSSGIYFLTIETEDEILVRKLVKE